MAHISFKMIYNITYIVRLQLFWKS